MTNAKKFVKSIWCKVALLVFIIALALLYKGIRARAVFDGEATAVTYRSYVGSHTIENGTIFLGTHLIHLDAATSELFDKAKSSATDSGQDGMYYKSEMADGTWFEISSASTIDDISMSGEMVEDSALADLYIEYVTGSDGRTIRAKDGKEVSLFDIPDPYDLYNLPELATIRGQYDQLAQEAKERKDKDKELKGSRAYQYKVISSFFKTKVKTAETDQYDKQLADLQKIYKSLTDAGETNQAAIVNRLMGKIDANRRAAVFRILSQGDDSAINNLLNKVSGSGYDEDDYDDIVYAPDASQITSVSDALSSCSTSYETHLANTPMDADTVLGHAEYENGQAVIAASGNGNSPSFRNALLRLSYIYNYQDVVVDDDVSELDYLKSTLMPLIDSKYQGTISTGISAEYRQHVKAKKPDSVLENDLLLQKNTAEAARMELQQLISAATLRMIDEDKVLYLSERLEWTKGLNAYVKNDAFKAGAKDSINLHIVWLESELKKVIDGNAGMNTEQKDLEKQIDDLHTDIQEALDENDLQGAKKLEAQLEALNIDLDKLKDKNGDGGDDLTNSAIAAYANGDFDKGNQLLDALMKNGRTSDAKAVLGALQDNAGALGAANGVVAANGGLDDGSGDDTGDGTGDGTDDGTGDGTGDGSGDGTSYTLSESELKDLLGKYGGFDSFDAAGKIAVTVALDWYYDQDGASAAYSLSGTYLSKCYADSATNKYLFIKCPSGTAEMLPGETIGKCTEYRFVYDDKKKAFTLEKEGSGRVYSFVPGSNKVTLPNKKTKTMVEQAVRVDVGTSKICFIPEATAKEFFNVESEFLHNKVTVEGVAKTCGALMKQSMMNMAKEWLSRFREAAKELAPSPTPSPSPTASPNTSPTASPTPTASPNAA